MNFRRTTNSDLAATKYEVRESATDKVAGVLTLAPLYRAFSKGIRQRLIHMPSRG